MMACRDGRLLVAALDTSTDMLDCAVASWRPGVDASGAPCAAVELLAQRDHPCRRRSNQELLSSLD